MKRLIGLVVLMLAASAAQADSISFSVGGQRVRIDAPRNCRSASCASISIPGVYKSRRKRWDDEDREVVAAPPPAPSPPAVGFAPAVPAQQVAPPPAPPPAAVAPPAIVAPPPAPAPAPKLIVVMVPAPTPLAVYKPAAATTQEVAAPLPPAPPVQAAMQPRPPEPAAKPAAKPVDAKPPVLKVLREDDAPDSPVGDWQTENKGLVRIAECGRALCGYTIKPGEDEKGEAVLINMKPKTASQWTGSVYSKDSGDTYYGAINLNGPNTLRVEACAIGRFYCHGNHWTRVPPKTDRVITSRQVDQQPRT